MTFGDSKDVTHLQQYKNPNLKNTMQITQVQCKRNLYKM